MSEQLRSLERSLGVTLFERSPTGLRLTDAGRLAFEHTSVMFRAGERLVESLGHDTPEVPRTLRVGLSSAVARATSSDFLMPLLALDDCVPVIRTADSVDLLRALRGSELDLALCENEPPDLGKRGLEVVAIASTTLVAIAPPSLETTQDWQGIGFIHYRPSSSYRWEVEAFLATRKLVPRLAGEVDDSMFMIEAAARGGYIAVVPKPIARDAIVAGRLKVLAQFEPSQSGVFALFHDGASKELARRAVDILIEHVRSQAD